MVGRVHLTRATKDPKTFRHPPLSSFGFADRVVNFARGAGRDNA